VVCAVAGIDKHTFGQSGTLPELFVRHLSQKFEFFIVNVQPALTIK
jgi:hypothetical protein